MPYSNLSCIYSWASYASWLSLALSLSIIYLYLRFGDTVSVYLKNCACTHKPIPRIKLLALKVPLHSKQLPTWYNKVLLIKEKRQSPTSAKPMTCLNLLPCLPIQQRTISNVTSLKSSYNNLPISFSETSSRHFLHQCHMWTFLSILVHLRQCTTSTFLSRWRMPMAPFMPTKERNITVMQGSTN